MTLLPPWDQMIGFGVGVVTLALSLAAAIHAILLKRDVRAAIGWVGLIVLVPGIGALLYFLLGINRIQRRASALRDLRSAPGVPALEGPSEAVISAQIGEDPTLLSLRRVGNQVTRLPLLAGNRVEPLVNGEEAFPAMLEAIAGARRTLGLATYIFDNDMAGRLFLDALADAVRRGVEVRVLVDAVGARFSMPPIHRALRKAGVPVARFLPTLLPWRMPFANLRNHRKILVADGELAFTGGMNIRHGHLVSANPPSPVQDLHFRLEGPVVAELQEVFVHDWHFATREALAGEGWFPRLESRGEVLARAVADGPDEDFDKLRWVLLGALASARTSIRLVNPYFLPDQALITGLNVAALRGVEVTVLLPQVNNLPVVHWATMAQLWQILDKGCRVFLTRPPFDHSKLLVVDGAWCFVGSANWDPRSLRLSFELNVECYDRGLAQSLEDLVAAKLASAHELTLEELDGRPFLVRLRDGVARLLTPYL
jgi:cardiolipin synthase A/B